MLPDDFKLDKEAIAEAAAEHGVEVEVDGYCPCCTNQECFTFRS